LRPTSVPTALITCIFVDRSVSNFFFFNAPPTSEIYTLSLHDALPISLRRRCSRSGRAGGAQGTGGTAGWCRRARLRAPRRDALRDRKSTRLNSSHVAISYAVFCLKKKKKKKNQDKSNNVSHMHSNEDG